MTRMSAGPRTTPGELSRPPQPGEAEQVVLAVRVGRRPEVLRITARGAADHHHHRLVTTDVREVPVAYEIPDVEDGLRFGDPLPVLEEQVRNVLVPTIGTGAHRDPSYLSFPHYRSALLWAPCEGPL